MSLLELRIMTNRRNVIVTAVICLALLGYVDWITGPNVAFTCFYLIPVCLLTWFAGQRIGYFVSAIHALVWLGIDAETIGMQSPLVYWNLLVRFVTFAVVVWLIHLTRNLTAEIESLVKDKTMGLQRELDAQAAASEAIQKLAHEVSTAEEAERRRLAQELHDALGQSLAMLKLRLESLRGDLPEGDASRQLGDSVQLLGDIIHSSRTLTFELHPAMLEQLGLTATLRNYAQQLATQTKASVRVVDLGPEVHLPSAAAAFLFRATKELLTNAFKHGLAHDILIQIRRQPDLIRIVVNDDGRGFQTDFSTGPGIGLAWIRERMRSFGGVLDIESEVGQGARVTLDLPVHSETFQTGSRVYGHNPVG